MNLLEGNIVRTLVHLSLPMIWGMFSIVVFNLADTYFIGQLGATELAAISYTFPVVLFFGSLSIGLSMGATAVVSNAYGQKNSALVQRYSSDSVTLSFLLVCVFSALGYATIEPTFRLMGASPDLMPLIRDYMEIWYFGLVFLVVPMVSNGAIRGIGDTKSPALIMTVAAVANILLDPLLIFGGLGIPAMGIKGAAVATVLARAITLVASLYWMHFRLKVLSFRQSSWHDFRQSSIAMLKIGLPSAGANLIVPLGIGFVTGILSRFGHTAVAAFGVVSRLESFAMIVMIGFSTALAPFVGQNFGAKQIERVHAAFRLAVGFSLVWGILMGGVYYFFHETLISLFNEDPGVIAYASIYMVFVPFSYGLEGIRLIATTVYNALGSPLPPSLMALLRMIVLYVPLAYLGANYWGVAGVFWAQFLGNVVVGLAAIYFLSSHLKRLF